MKNLKGLIVAFALTTSATAAFGECTYNFSDTLKYKTVMQMGGLWWHCGYQNDTDIQGDWAYMCLTDDDQPSRIAALFVTKASYAGKYRNESGAWTSCRLDRKLKRDKLAPQT